MPEVDEQEGLTLADYVRILRKNWLLITLATVLGAVGAGVFSLLSTPQYQASTQLYVSVQSTADDTQIANLTQGGTYARQAVLSYVDIIESASVLDEVIEDLDLDMSTGELRGMVSANSPTNSVLINIDVTGPDADQAAAVANSVGTNFTELVTDVLEKPRSGGLSPVQISTTEQAKVPTAPISPNTTRNVALGLMLGLMVGLGLAVLRTALDTRVRRVEDIARITDLPVIAGILDDPQATKRRLIVHTDPTAPRSESFRTLRTALQFVNVDNAPRSFAVTSSAPAEGKTTVSTNLAIALAQAGASVALIDGDMRKPSVAQYMGIEGAVGLSNVLAGLVELDDVLQRWGRTKLFILPAGRIPPNPSELLGSAKMRDLLEELTTRFDYVIIDTPPVLSVTDAVVVSRLAGATMLVAASGIARRGDVLAALDSLDDSAERVVGVVMTHMPHSGPDAYAYARYEYKRVEDGRKRRGKRIRATKDEASDLQPRVLEHPLGWLDEPDDVPSRHARK